MVKISELDFYQLTTTEMINMNIIKAFNMFEINNNNILYHILIIN